MADDSKLSTIPTWPTWPLRIEYYTVTFEYHYPKKKKGKRINSKKPWKLNDTHTDRLAAQKKDRVAAVEFFKKNRVIDELRCYQKKQINDIKAFLDGDV